MCTVTWSRNPDGLTLLMNRDELWSRGAAEPPRELDRDGMPVLAPLDTDAGGTWIAVNAAGVVLCLLNRYPSNEPGWQRPAGAGESAPSPRESRGALVLRHSSARSAAEVPVRLARADLRRYSPFTLLAIDRDTDPSLSRWDGFRLEVARAEPPIASSSFDEQAVIAARVATYRAIVGAEPTRDALRAYHRSHLPHRGPYSVCAHRDDGGSRSLTEVHVGADEIVMRYEPGAPCETGPARRATMRPLTRG